MHANACGSARVMSDDETARASVAMLTSICAHIFCVVGWERQCSAIVSASTATLSLLPCIAPRVPVLAWLAWLGWLVWLVWLVWLAWLVSHNCLIHFEKFLVSSNSHAPHVRAHKNTFKLYRGLSHSLTPRHIAPMSPPAFSKSYTHWRSH